MVVFSSKKKTRINVSQPLSVPFLIAYKDIQNLHFDFIRSVCMTTISYSGSI